MIKFRNSKLAWLIAGCLSVFLFGATNVINWKQINPLSRNGTDAYGQSSDGTHTSGDVPTFDSNGGLTASYAVQGTDSKVLTAGTVSGTAATLCTDANGGATTSGCSGGSTGALVQLSQQVLASPAATVTIPPSGSIPSGYTDLVLAITAKASSTTNGAPAINAEFSGDSGNNYFWSVFYTNGSTSLGGSNSGSGFVNAVHIGFITNSYSSTPSLAPGVTECTIFNYLSTAFGKVYFSNTSYVYTVGSGSPVGVGGTSGMWNSASAVTSIVLSISDASNFVTGSTFTLYGRQ